MNTTATEKKANSLDTFNKKTDKNFKTTQDNTRKVVINPAKPEADKVEYSCKLNFAGFTGIIYYPEGEKIFAVYDDELKSLQSDGKLHQEKMDALHAAIDSKDAKAIASAKSKLLKHLENQKLAGATKNECNLKEVIDLSEGRNLFVNVKILDKILTAKVTTKRLFPLVTKAIEIIEEPSKPVIKPDPDMVAKEKPSANKDFVTHDPKSDILKELPKQFKLKRDQLKALIKAVQDDMIKYLKGNVSCKIAKSGQLEIYEPFDKWVQSVEKYLTFPETSDQTKYFHYKAESGVSMMRYYAGAGSEADFNLKEGKLSLKGDGRIDYTVLDAKAKTELQIPSKEGFELKISNYRGNRNGVEGDDGIQTNESPIPAANFDFDRSFLLPDFIKTLKAVETEVLSDDTARLRLVGHTDAVGSNSYNDLLSERRVQSVYAFINNDVDAWMKLRQTEGWSLKELKSMLIALSRMPGKSDFNPGPRNNKNNSTTISAIHKYQTSNGLTSTGAANDATWRQVITDYMGGTRDIKLNKNHFVPSDPCVSYGEDKLLIDTQAKSKENRRVVFEIVSLIDKEQLIPLGDFKCILNLELSAYVGANIVAGVDVELSVDKQLLMRGLKGHKNDKASALYQADEHAVDQTVHNKGPQTKTKNTALKDIIKNKNINSTTTTTNTTGQEMSTTQISGQATALDNMNNDINYVNYDKTNNTAFNVKKTTASNSNNFNAKDGQIKNVKKKELQHAKGKSKTVERQRAVGSQYNPIDA